MTGKMVSTQAYRMPVAENVVVAKVPALVGVNVQVAVTPTATVAAVIVYPVGMLSIAFATLVQFVIATPLPMFALREA
jgi:hypothetical protein